MIITEISGGIPHFEDLSHSEIIHLLTNLDKFQVTEKIDGAQILFGIDEYGFYTSRETKGGKRIYNEADYGITFASTYMRSAHKLLEQVLPRLRDAGLRPGDQVEAEVLYGELPNVVPYSEDTNYLIFLRTTEGNVNIDRLQQKLNEQAVSVSLMSPYTENGKSIELREETNNWKFARVPMKENTASSISVGVYLREIKEFLDVKDLFIRQSHKTILETPLNKIPDWVKSGTWKEVKEQLKGRKEYISGMLMYGHILPIKEVLLNRYVKNASSSFGPTVEEGGWIEGVVLREKKTGKMVKLVDKDKFGKIREAAWAKRNELTESARNIEGANSYLGTLYLGLATSLGHPELGTTQAKNYIRKVGLTEDLVEKINFNEVRQYWIQYLGFKKLQLLEVLDKYEKETFRIPGSPQTISERLAAAIKTRTLQTFAQTFAKINENQEATLRAANSKDLLHILIGKYLGDH